MRLSCESIRYNETHIMLAREVLEMLVLTRSTGNVLGVRSQGVRRLGYQRKAMQTDGYTNDD